MCNIFISDWVKLGDHDQEVRVLKYSWENPDMLQWVGGRWA